MNSFLNKLITRSLGLASAVQPRLPSFFEPVSDAAQGLPPEDPAANNAFNSELIEPITTHFSMKREIPPVNRSLTMAETVSRLAHATGQPRLTARPTDAKCTPRSTDLVKNETGTKRLPELKEAASIEGGEFAEQPIEKQTHKKQTIFDLPANTGERISRPQNPIEQLETALKYQKKYNAADTRTPTVRPAVMTYRPLPSELPASPLEVTPAAPSIHVNIGRIEVRAVSPPAPTIRQQPKSGQRKEILSLDDYLKDRRLGGRR